jgi:Xaa-Pro aminopeptidase
VSVAGIGLQVHEGPYLVGNTRHVLQTGNTFSDEPGVYIEGSVRYPPFILVCQAAYRILQFGIRLEDCFVVTDGGAVPLTSGIGGLARHPWDP